MALAHTSLVIGGHGFVLGTDKWKPAKARSLKYNVPTTFYINVDGEAIRIGSTPICQPKEEYFKALDHQLYK